MCVLLGLSLEFLVDPYYEPLVWFMILSVTISWDNKLKNKLCVHNGETAINVSPSMINSCWD